MIAISHPAADFRDRDIPLAKQIGRLVDPYPVQVLLEAFMMMCRKEAGQIRRVKMEMPRHLRKADRLPIVLIDIIKQQLHAGIALLQSLLGGLYAIPRLPTELLEQRSNAADMLHLVNGLEVRVFGFVQRPSVQIQAAKHMYDVKQNISDQ
ncbi:hypothetical protein D3C77_520130 [compost metagenome]